ncbi:hypothetical protein NPIL_324021, partial [Nephila pilipes]
MDMSFIDKFPTMDSCGDFTNITQHGVEGN